MQMSDRWSEIAVNKFKFPEIQEWKLLKSFDQAKAKKKLMKWKDERFLLDLYQISRRVKYAPELEINLKDQNSEWKKIYFR